MSGPENTRALVIFGILSIIIYDVFVIYFWGPDAAISTLIRDWARDHPMIPFVAGLLIAHLFWRD